MGQTGTRGRGSERKAASPSGLGRAGPWRGLRAQREGRQLARGRRECSSAPQPRAQQKLQAGVRQPPARASRGAVRVPSGLGYEAAVRVPPSPAARSLHAHCWGATARLFYLLFVVYSSPSARAWQRPGGRGTGVGGAPPEFPSRERVRGILNGKPDPESSDQASSDYSPLAPPFLPPPPPDLHKKGQENSGGAPAAAHSAAPGRSPPGAARGLAAPSPARNTSPAQSPRARRLGPRVARFPGPGAAPSAASGPGKSSGPRLLALPRLGSLRPPGVAHPRCRRAPAPCC